MDKLIIEGGSPLHGEVRVNGSKNAALPILLACMLVPEQVTLHSIPNLRDIATTMNLLHLLGCETDQSNGEITVRAGKELHPEAPYDLVRTMRASVLCLGPLLARLGRAKVALPGGCAIGTRPVDLHLRALERMGALMDIDSGYIDARCRRLQGAHITFDFPTVGGTENLLMAAALAQGETVLENAAREPEVQDLANFLNSCGARIQGQGTSIIRIQGVESLHGCTYPVMPDRIEAGTYMLAAAITNGDLEVVNCPLEATETTISKLQEMGGQVTAGDSRVRVRGGELQGVDIVTQPYPGFPTDMQAQFMALMCVAQGSGTIQETIFENRFMHAMELMRLGARIRISGDTAVIRGGGPLRGATLMASDLRASASLVLAGLAAQGRTEIRRIYHLDRGYERMEDKLARVGARIRREQEK
ncbi:UDP-N-acetylglucosamine 1-carboxyvinyltransferase [Desulfovermiculus halophilus]|uniref:UDP-N-acetylglucosamine 1-carboxyvinyltransferase n=1 Tax=Desulfovermiculus halophilus TaxID=339722 RepID=UPI0004848966|nr:UDP-N-acetylglucosamine 1-carboxyvinyltransferase [Desulfovermiculus halophilus]